MNFVTPMLLCLIRGVVPNLFFYANMYSTNANVNINVVMPMATIAVVTIQ